MIDRQLAGLGSEVRFLPLLAPHVTANRVARGVYVQSHSSIGACTVLVRCVGGAVRYAVQLLCVVDQGDGLHTRVPGLQGQSTGSRPSMGNMSMGQVWTTHLGAHGALTALRA